MNINTFERKTFLNSPILTIKNNSMFYSNKTNNSVIVNVDLERATANEAEQFKEYLNQQSIKKENTLIVDLSKSTFIDSTFLSTIVSFSKKINLKRIG